MRRIYREELPLPLRKALHQRDKAAKASGQVRREWNAFRSSGAGRGVASKLGAIAGMRMRCFYCSDSLGADIDHFMPITGSPDKAFHWNNHLLVCSPCNRAKGSKFPTDNHGSPLLIDPTVADPWSFLYLDTQTAVIAERYDSNGPSAVGSTTLEIIRPINFESAIEGRARTIRRLQGAARALVAPDPDSTQLRDLWDEVAGDDYGVARWFAIWDGADEDPFAIMKNRFPARWRRFVRLSLRRY
jgi:5-methylcytosine-specific restriction endonuclease McrA